MAAAAMARSALVRFPREEVSSPYLKGHNKKLYLIEQL